MCIRDRLSGTDYNLHQKVTLHKSLKYYQEYKQQIHSCGNFYEWLSNNHISNAETLYNIYNMFIMESTHYPQQNVDNGSHFKEVKPSRQIINWTKLREFLVPYGFVFL